MIDLLTWCEIELKQEHDLLYELIKVRKERDEVLERLAEYEARTDSRY